MNLRLLLHFLDLRITTHSEQIASWIDQYFQSYDQTHLFPHKHQQFRLTLEESGSSFEQTLISAPSRATQTRFSLLHAPCFYFNGTFYSQHTGMLQQQTEIDFRQRTARINLGGAFLENSEYLIYHVMRDILRKLLFPLHGIVGVHSAIVTRGSDTICLTGQAGAGKSTLALKLTESGFSILSDDLPMVTLDRDRALAFSSLDCLSLSKKTLSLCPAWRDKVTGHRELSSKLLVRLRDLPAGVACSGPCIITHFVELRRGNHELRLFKTNKKDAVRESIKSFMCLLSPLPTTDVLDSQEADRICFDTILRLFDNASTYALEYKDEDLSELPLIIASLCGNY